MCVCMLCVMHSTTYGWLPVLSFRVGVDCHCVFYFADPKRGAAYLLKGQADIW